MRITGIVIIMIGMAFAMNAQTVAKTTPEKELNPAVVKAQIEQLKAQQKKDAIAMHKLRLKLLKTDPELKKMHDSIMSMHLELSLKMAANKQMQALIMNFDQAGNQIRKLETSIKSTSNTPSAK